MKKNLREIAKSALKQSSTKKTNNKTKQRGYNNPADDAHGADQVSKVVPSSDLYGVTGGFVPRNPKAAGYLGASPWSLRHGGGESDIRDSDYTAAKRKRNNLKKMPKKK